MRRYELLDARASRTTNRVGLLMVGSSLLLAYTVSWTGLDVREHLPRSLEVAFAAAGLHAATSLNHEREAFAVWAYLSALSPALLVWLVARCDGIAAEDTRHLVLSTLVFGSLGLGSVAIAWALGSTGEMLLRWAALEPRGYLSRQHRETLPGMAVGAALVHFLWLFSCLVLIKTWSARLRPGS